MSLSNPTPPDPNATAATQAAYNEQAAQKQAEMNMVNQVTPYGSLTYNQTGTASDGTPMFTGTQSYTPQMQGLLNTMLNTQQGIGTAANQLIGNLGSSLTKAPNLDTSTLTNKMMNWFNQYEQPIWNQQQSNLNSQLAAQGITQGSAAYNNAQNLQARNVGDATNQYLMQAEPTAFNQAVTQYQLPIQTLGTLLGESQPSTSINQQTTQTPQESIQSPNYSGDAYASYNAQNQNYGNMMSGIFGGVSALAGGLGRVAPLLAASDIRVKENIKKVGKLDNGLPIYIFNYKTDPDGVPQVGLMAQDVEKIYPDAVVEINGIKHVDYSRAVRNV